MSKHNPQLNCHQVKQILTNLGFAFIHQKGSHEQWKREGDGRKVTVDCPKAPFSHTLIKYMCGQAGVSKKEFYAALNKKK